MFRLWVVASVLWVVASVLWVGIIGNIGYGEWRTVPEPGKLYLLPNATSAAASDFYTADNIFNRFDPGIEQSHSIIEYPHGVTLMIHNSVPSDVAELKKKEFERDYVAPVSRDYDKKHYDTGAAYLEAALLPPLGVLAFGAAMAWALTGFRREPR
jgi:hypothetical protein